MTSHNSSGHVPRRKVGRGITLIEVVVVVTVLGILVSITAPCYRNAIEQARLDVAAVHLRSIWTAQRMYYLENRTYAPDLGTLATNDLLDIGALAADPWYSYQLSSNGSTYSVTASRNGSTVYSGALSIGPEGVVSGNLSRGTAIPMVPGFQ